MRISWEQSYRRLSFFLALSLALVSGLTSCGRDGGCDGPAFDEGALSTFRQSGRDLFSANAAARGFLVVPNPLEATNRPNVSPLDSVVADSAALLGLPFLSSPSSLENAFMRIRQKELGDDPSILARPDGQGRYVFNILDPRYSEVMAYHSLNYIFSYVRALGFPVVQSRPLFVMVRAVAPSGDPNEINALYDHNYLNPNKPRTIRLFGGTNFAPGMDQDMYWHEFGHLFNESVSREVGMDFAGDSGAIFTEGSAIHECLADYLAQSLSDKDYIGKWIARNFPEYRAGDPLRSAVDTPGQALRFADVVSADGTGSNPERYKVAEWCTRVLWQIRSQITAENSKDGALISDRLIFSAVSRFPKDVSIRQFYSQLLQADQSLHCGGHSRVIQDAFVSRGFIPKPDSLSRPLDIQVKPRVLQGSNSSGSEVDFNITIRNSDTVTARNVRVFLESGSQGLVPISYMQGYGDLASGRSLSIGKNGNLPVQFSVYAQLLSSGKNPYRIRVQAENGPEAVSTGVVP